MNYINPLKLKRLLPGFKLSVDFRQDVSYANFVKSRNEKVELTFGKFMNLPSISINTVNTDSFINEFFFDGLESLFNQEFNGVVLLNPLRKLIKSLSGFECLNDSVACYDDLFSSLNRKGFTHYFFSDELATNALSLDSDELLCLKPKGFSDYELKISNNVNNISFFNDKREEVFVALTNYLNTPAIFYVSRSDSLKDKGLGRGLINELMGLMKSKGESRLLIKDPFIYRIPYYESLGAVHDNIPYESLKLYYIPLN